MRFADELKAERDRLSLSRAEAAALLRDVSASWIDKAESGVREPHGWMQAEALRRLRSIKKRPNQMSSENAKGEARAESATSPQDQTL